MSYTNTNVFAKGMLNLPTVGTQSPLSISKDSAPGFLGSGGLKRAASGLLDWAPKMDWTKERNWGGMLPWRWADKGDGSPPVMQDWGQSGLGGGNSLQGGWNSPQNTYQRSVESGNMDTTFTANPYGEGRTQDFTPSAPGEQGNKWLDMLKGGLLGMGMANANQEGMQSPELPLLQSSQAPMNFSYHQGM